MKIKQLSVKSIRIIRSVKDLSLYLIATILNVVIGIIINPFIAANLSPEDYAIIGYFTSFNLLILPIISFSFLSYYSKNYFRINENERQSILNTLLVTQLVLGTATLLIVLAGFYLYMQIEEVNFPFFPYAFLCFIPVLFNCFYNFLLIQKRMQRQAFSYFKIVLVNSIAGAFFAILLVVILKGGAAGRLWAILIPSAAAGIYSIFKLLSQFRFDKITFLNALSFSWPISLSAILIYFFSGVDRAILEQLNDKHTFGIYSVAIQITTYMFVFYTAIKQTFEPDIYKAIAEKQLRKLTRLFIGIIALNALANVLFILFARPVVDILTFGRYTESSTFAVILAVKNIPMSIYFLISTIIIGFGFSKIELLNRIVGALLSFILLKILISKYGFYGAAWGQSVSFMIMTVIGAGFLLLKISPAKGGLLSGVTYVFNDLTTIYSKAKERWRR